MTTTLRLLLQRRVLLSRRTTLDFRPLAAHPDLDSIRAALTVQLAENAEAVGLDRLGRWPRLLIDGALGGIAAYEAGGRVPERFEWLTWPSLGLLTIVGAIFLSLRKGPRGLLLLGVAPLAALACAIAGAVNAASLAVLGNSFFGRVLAGVIAGALACIVVVAICIPFLAVDGATVLKYALLAGAGAGCFLVCLDTALSYVLDL